MTTPVSNISRTNLNLLDPNLAVNQIADPALRKNCFDEIYNYFDTFVTAYNAFIANGGIATSNLADLSVTTAKIALLAVTAAQIADATITTGKIGVGAVTSTNILDATIVTGDLADAAISTAKLIDLAVTTAKIALLAIGTAQIADGAVTSAKILDGTISTADLADALITTAKLALLSVTTAQLADSSVTSAKIVDGTIATGDIADGAITSLKIADGTIVNADVNASAAIDGSKLANLSITSAQIADGAVMNVDINASAAIDASKIGAGTVSNTEFGYLDGVTQAIQTQINGIVLGSIPDGSLTDVKLDNGATSVKAKVNAALPSSSYTAADVLTKIKTVDGAGSGLDADLLDGLDSTAFVNLTTAQSIGGNKTFTGHLLTTNNTLDDGSGYMRVSSPTYNDVDGILRVENTHTGAGGSSAQILARNQYGSAQLMKWDAFGVRIGMRSIANGDTGAMQFTYGNDTVGITLDGSGNTTLAGSLTAGAGGSFANSKATNGYQKLPGGIIIMWGSSIISTTGTVITFPIAFPSFAPTVTLSPIYNSAVGYVSAISTSQMTVISSVNTITFNWIAIGY